MTLEFANLSLGGKPFSSVSKLIRPWQTVNCGWKDPRPQGELTEWDVNFAALLPSQSTKDAAIKLAKGGVTGCLTVIGKAGAACDAWVLTEKVDDRIVVVASGSHTSNGQRWLAELLSKRDQRALPSRSARPAQRVRTTNGATPPSQVENKTFTADRSPRR
jgi:hypothetical protein